MWRALGGARAPLRPPLLPRARPGAGRGGGRPGAESRRRQPGLGESSAGFEVLGRRTFSSGGAGARTQLGAYLERCGATWGDAAEVHSVVPSPCGREFVWRVDLAPERLRLLRPGEPLESPPFQPTPGGGQARFQLFPKGDAEGAAGGGKCSLWLWSDALEPAPFSLRVGGTRRASGASDFCALEAELSDGVLEVGLRLEEAPGGAPAEARPAATVGQSLQLTGLQLAEWRLHRIGDMLKAGMPVSSPPFRFHHVLLGDMYLELRPGGHPELCGLHFRCPVPTMKLQVGLSVGTCFSKSFVAEGRSTPEQDVAADRWLQVNLDVPGALDDAGALVVRCALEEVVELPAALRDMIPKLDERANWPKRL